MKKKIIVSFAIGILLGCLWIYKTTHTKKALAFALQVGAYQEEKNAWQKKEEFNGIIRKEDSYYKVYACILKDKDTLEKVEAYFTKKNISYIRKEIEIEGSESTNLYEQLLKTIEDSKIESVLKQMNTLYQ